jgi:putative transposase
VPHSSRLYRDEWVFGMAWRFRYYASMPYGLRRYQRAESLHFITFSCFHRLPYLSGPAAKSEVEEILEQTRARHQACLYAYVLMPEHMHLLINEPPGILLGQFLKVVKQATARKLKGEREHFWQARYFDRNVRGEEARTEVIQYIHRNPVKRGLVRTPEEFAWSSFNHYCSGIQGAVTIESEWPASSRRRQGQVDPIITMRQ